jgi:HlyD family type I secretion membrane fusion protein
MGKAASIETKKRVSKWPTRRYSLLGAATLVFGLGGFFGWAASTEINGAVIASGKIEVLKGHQTIQHQFGGLISAIHVKDGDVVKAGDPLITLDGLELKTEETALTRQLFETHARLERLHAELRGKTEFQFSPELLDQAGKQPSLQQSLDGERELFETRRDVTNQTTIQIDEQKKQKATTIEGLSVHRNASTRQLQLLRDDVKIQESLVKKRLSEGSKLTSYQRELARMEGEIGELTAQISEAKSTIASLESERLRITANWMEEARNELLRVQPIEAEISNKVQAIQQQLLRLVLRAPASGTVYEMQAKTIGGILPPAGIVAAIIPDNEPYVVAIRINPANIDQVATGQRAILHFPTFNARTTPELSAKVLRISADAILDQPSGGFYYNGWIEPDAKSLAIMGENFVTPGMPVEAFIQSEARSPLSFLTKPISDYFDLAMKEK